MQYSSAGVIVYAIQLQRSYNWFKREITNFKIGLWEYPEQWNLQYFLFLINQSIDQSINQTLDQSINQSINQSIGQPIYLAWINQSIDQSNVPSIGSILCLS